MFCFSYHYHNYRYYYNSIKVTILNPFYATKTVGVSLKSVFAY